MKEKLMHIMGGSIFCGSFFVQNVDVMADEELRELSEIRRFCLCRLKLRDW